MVRARAVKAELSDVEGLGFKLEERQKDIMELKKALKMKVSGVGFFLFSSLLTVLYAHALPTTHILY